MIYLREFTFPSKGGEWGFFMGLKRNCYDSFYPFRIIAREEETKLSFAPVTILYGGNGSGKTTALNVIAETLGLSRDALYNRSSFFEDYTALCRYVTAGDAPAEQRIIASDDVFDYMLNVRTINQGIDQKREDLFVDYLDAKYSTFQMKSLEDYENLKRVNASRRKSQSQYVRGNLMDNVRERSNGESGFKYFMEKIGENGLYLLDEPENSLSPEKQMELAQFISESARFFGCQFIISTHSPFLLAMQGAKIYDMTEEKIREKNWTELKSVRTYFDFFRQHEREF